MDVYQRNGYSGRDEYLDNLANEYGGDVVYALADMLGPNEDFDGLITELEEASYMFSELFGDF